MVFCFQRSVTLLVIKPTDCESSVCARHLSKQFIHIIPFSSLNSPEVGAFIFMVQSRKLKHEEVYVTAQSLWRGRCSPSWNPEQWSAEPSLQPSCSILFLVKDKSTGRASHNSGQCRVLKKRLNAAWEKVSTSEVLHSWDLDKSHAF